MLFPSLRVFLLLPALAVLVRALPTTVGELAPELDLGETTELELDFGEHHSGLEGRAPKATVYTQCTATAASGKRVAFTFVSKKSHSCWSFIHGFWLRMMGRISGCEWPGSGARCYDDLMLTSFCVERRDVVNEFKKYNGKTTFFVSKCIVLSPLIFGADPFVDGQNWGQCIYNTASVDRLKYAYSQGMQIGSHTWAHKDLITLSRTQSAFFTTFLTDMC